MFLNLDRKLSKMIVGFIFITFLFGALNYYLTYFSSFVFVCFLHFVLLTFTSYLSLSLAALAGSEHHSRDTTSTLSFRETSLLASHYNSYVLLLQWTHFVFLLDTWSFKIIIQSFKIKITKHIIC